MHNGHLRVLTLLLLLILSILPHPARAQERTAAVTTRPATAEPKTVRLLTVGNSFAVDATRYLRDLAMADGNRVILGGANVNGCSLERHWRAVEAFEADPTSAAGLFYTVGPERTRLSLRQLLEREPWDVVTIQQASPLSDDERTYHPYAPLLHDYIKRHAPQAEVVIHQTWAYRQDHPRFRDGKTNPTLMHERIRAAYHALAGTLKLRIVPVGDAMFAGVNHPDWRYQPDATFDAAALQYPLLPEEPRSLHVGWRWVRSAGGEPRLRLDGYHANVYGSYLGACVFYEFLFGRSAVGNPFVPPTVSPADAARLQQLAHQTLNR